MTFASILDSLGDVTSVIVGTLAFATLFLLLKGFERV
jgi:hypothetical protein